MHAPLPVSALLAVLALAGCSAPHAAVPATAPASLGSGVGGYLTGDLLEGRAARTMRVVAAGIGGIAPDAIGGYMDRQERALREQAMQSDAHVVRSGDDLIVATAAGANFAYRSAEVAPAFRATLDRIARVLVDYPQSYVDIYGHTDATGGDAYNRQLSERRARAVAAYLETRGVIAARLATRGFGRAQPVAANDSDAGRAANRRVEIKIVPISTSDTRARR